MKKGISVCLLSYKEAENLKFLIPQIKEQLDQIAETYEIMIIDTEKPLDDTPEVCEAYACRYINQEMPYFGGAFRTGIKYARYDKFLIMDSDGSHNPKYIPKIYGTFIKKNADIVIGSRYVKGGQNDGSIPSVLMSRILNFIYRLALGIKVKDMSTDYRMYRTADLKKVRLECRNYDILEEVLLKIKLTKPSHRLKIYEIPIRFEKRKYGSSKRRLFKFIVGYIKTLFRLTGMRILRRQR